MQFRMHNNIAICVLKSKELKNGFGWWDQDCSICKMEPIPLIKKENNLLVLLSTNLNLKANTQVNRNQLLKPAVRMRFVYPHFKCAKPWRDLVCFSIQ